MAQAVELGVSITVTFADATVVRLTGDGPTHGDRIEILEATGGTIYVVTDDVADGAALPASGRIPVDVSVLPVSVPIRGYGQIGLAQDVAGNCHIVCN